MAFIVDVDFVDEAEFVDINRDFRIEHGFELRHQIIGDAVELSLRQSSLRRRSDAVHGS